jgi:hypothetical protein
LPAQLVIRRHPLKTSRFCSTKPRHPSVLYIRSEVIHNAHTISCSSASFGLETSSRSFLHPSSFTSILLCQTIPPAFVSSVFSFVQSSYTLVHLFYGDLLPRIASFCNEIYPHTRILPQMSEDLVSMGF